MSRPVSKAAYRARISHRNAKIKRLEDRLNDGAGAAENVTVDAEGPLDIEAGIRWIEDNLIVPTGRLAGQPFRLDDWQKDWIRGAFAEGISKAGLSVSRRNGKSGVLQAIVACILEGPWNRPNVRLLMASYKGELAAKFRAGVVELLEASGFEVSERKSPKPGGINGQRGADLTCVNSERYTGSGYGADYVLLDELGLFKENQRAVYKNMTAATATNDGKVIAISIQGDGPLFAEMQRLADLDHVHWKRYSAPEDAALDDEEAWHAANPGLLSGIKSMDFMRDECAENIITPAGQAWFKAHHLNQSIDPDSMMVVSVKDWRACEVAPDTPLENERVAVGIDLGGSRSMSAIAAIGLRSGIMRVWGAYGDDPPIMQRGIQDGIGARYIEMVERGELFIYPGRVTPVALFGDRVFAELHRAGCQIDVCLGDTYRPDEFRDFLDTLSVSIHFELRRMGSGPDGSYDVRQFQQLIAMRQIKPVESLVMRFAISQSTLRLDTNGNPSIDRSKHNARIDALSAAVLAVGQYARTKDQSQGVATWATWDD